MSAFYFITDDQMVEASSDPKEITYELTTFNFEPKHAQKFQTQDFWSNFFKAKQIDSENKESDLESFEWYADFEDLLPVLQDGLIEGDA